MQSAGSTMPRCPHLQAFENQHFEDQIGFKQGNFGGTSSVEMKDSLADDSARLEKDSKKMNDLSVEGAAFAEDNDTTPKYQEVPENQTYP